MIGPDIQSTYVPHASEARSASDVVHPLTKGNELAIPEAPEFTVLWRGTEDFFVKRESGSLFHLNRYRLYPEPSVRKDGTVNSNPFEKKLQKDSPNARVKSGDVVYSLSMGVPVPDTVLQIVRTDVEEYGVRVVTGVLQAQKFLLQRDQELLAEFKKKGEVNWRQVLAFIETYCFNSPIHSELFEKNGLDTMMKVKLSNFDLLSTRDNQDMPLAQLLLDTAFTENDQKDKNERNLTKEAKRKLQAFIFDLQKQLREVFGGKVKLRWEGQGGWLKGNKAGVLILEPA